MNCKLCKYPDCAARGTDNRVDGVVCSTYEPITNADHMRAMTDKELADFIVKTQYRAGDYCPPTHKCAPDKPCEKCWLEWLKQEVKK